MRVIDLPQGSEDWLRARAGLVTASRMCDVLAKIKTGEAAARRDYRCQLVAEILTGVPQDDGFINAEMQHGIDTEPLARAAYEVATDTLVDQVGLVLHPTIERSAASPDGLVGADGVLEIKAPKTATHLQYLMDGVVPAKHEPQILWQLACTGRSFADFVSYDPRLPVNLRLFRVRLQRNEAKIKELTREVIAFLVDVDRMLETVKRFA